MLDVKCGSGAFMKTEAEGRVLAEKMVAIGKACGRNVAALVTNMDVPLGNCIGNSLEVMEAVEVLKGKDGDLRQLCSALAAQLLSLCHGWSREEADEKVRNAIDSGKAFATMEAWVAAQGGDARALTDHSLLPGTAVKYPVKAPCDGWICHMDAEKVGISSSLLGAGRMKKEDSIDYGAGIVLQRKTGDFVRAGETLAWLHTNDESRISQAEGLFLSALTWSEEKPAAQNLIYGIVR